MYTVLLMRLKHFEGYSALSTGTSPTTIHDITGQSESEIYLPGYTFEEAQQAFSLAIANPDISSCGVLGKDGSYSLEIAFPAYIGNASALQIQTELEQRLYRLFGK